MMESEHISALDAIFAEIAAEAGEDPEKLKHLFFERIQKGEQRTNEK